MSHRIFDGMTIDGHEVDTSRLKDTGKVYVGDEEWDPSDLITDEDIQEDFDETICRAGPYRCPASFGLPHPEGPHPPGHCAGH